MLVVSCEVMGVGLVDLGFIVLELDLPFGWCFCLELGDLNKWTSGRAVSIVGVTGGFLELRGVAPTGQARKATHLISVHLF